MEKSPGISEVSGKLISKESKFSTVAIQGKQGEFLIIINN